MPAEHLVGRADELGSVDEVLAELGRGRWAAIELTGEPGIGKTRLLRELAARAEVSGQALQHERYRSHRAVRDLLAWLAAARPLVLILDDFHWADSASVELLGALLRRPPAAAVLLALGVCPRQMPERLTAALERVQREAG